MYAEEVAVHPKGILKTSDPVNYQLSMGGYIRLNMTGGSGFQHDRQGLDLRGRVMLKYHSMGI